MPTFSNPPIFDSNSKLSDATRFPRKLLLFLSIDILKFYPPILSFDPEFNNRKEKHATTGNICKYNNCKFIFVAARASSPLILRQICMAVSKQNERRSDVYRRAGITSVQRVTLTRRRKRRSRTHMPAGGLWPTKNVIKYGKEESVVK